MEMFRAFEAIATCEESDIPIASSIVAILDAGRFEEQLPAVIDPGHLVWREQIESMRYGNYYSEFEVAIDMRLSSRRDRQCR